MNKWYIMSLIIINNHIYFYYYIVCQTSAVVIEFNIVNITIAINIAAICIKGTFNQPHTTHTHASYHYLITVINVSRVYQ